MTLISAPTNLTPPYGSELVPVRTAAEMLNAVLAHTRRCRPAADGRCCGDFKPESAAEEKIKKGEDAPALPLTRTADILLEVGKRKVETGFPRITVGFAAESEIYYQTQQKNSQPKAWT